MFTASAQLDLLDQTADDMTTAALTPVKMVVCVLCGVINAHAYAQLDSWESSVNVKQAPSTA